MPVGSTSTVGNFLRRLLAGLLWQTAQLHLGLGELSEAQIGHFSALRDHFLRHFQQPASECENKGFSLWVAYSVSPWNKTGGALIPAADAESPHLQTVGSLQPNSVLSSSLLC